MTPVRIQKALADAGVASRRAAEILVAEGRVTINGRAAAVGERVDATVDAILVDGRPLSSPGRRLHLVMLKPPGVTSTVRDRHAARTVLDLVPHALRVEAGRLYPVGRLDRDSEGLLLLTNDGEWAQRVLHPRHEVEREYAVGLAMPLSESQRSVLLTGIELEEGLGRLGWIRRATSVEDRRLEAAFGPGERPLVWYRAMLRQGWKRQLRRMFAAVDQPVQRLVRVRIGTLRYDGMNVGDVRPLTAGERDGLESMARRTDRGERPSPRRRLVVSLDGPGSSGKSTVGSGAAARLGYRFCDTGLLYRGLAHLCLDESVDPDDERALLALIPRLRLATDAAGRYARVTTDGLDVTDRVHASQVDRVVSQVARHPAVRQALLPVQRELAIEPGIVMAGRDIGTVVLPDADLKVYLDVPLDVRAQRRAEERAIDPDDPRRWEIEEELRRRDGIDTTRAAAPLRIPEGAQVVHTAGNSLEQTIETLVAAVRSAETAAP